MSLAALDNLVRIGQLKAEPRNALEVRRLLTLARTRLADAQESMVKELCDLVASLIVDVQATIDAR